MNKYLRVLLFLMVLVASVTGGVVGKSDDGIVTDLVDDEDDNLLPEISEVTAAAGGAVDRLTFAVSGDSGTQTLGDDLQSEVNNNSQQYQDYLNDRVDASTNRNVIKVIQCTDGTTEIHFLTADVVNNSYQNVSMVDNTSRQVDEWVTLSGYAAQNAPDEMETFRSEFIADNETVGGEYAAELAGRYGNLVGSSLMDGERTC